VGTTQRRRWIVRTVDNDGYAEVKSLADRAGVDSSTIRRDLIVLADQGHVVRTHGGAKAVADANSPVGGEQDRRLRVVQIAEVAGRKVKPGDVVILDGGEIGQRIVSALESVEDLTVITNDLAIATQISRRSDVRLLMTGGELTGPGSILGGERTVQSMGGLLADWAFIEVDGVDPLAGITVSTIAQLATKRAFMDAAARTCALADSSLFGKRTLTRIGAIDAFDLIITDSDLPDEALPAYLGRVVRAAEPTAPIAVG
jgi:DeoR/GlpR family transcriptional regulator of sugar metabolism